MSKHINTTRTQRPKICGVYKVVNPIGEIYVGSSKDIIGHRWTNYKRGDAPPELRESILKYGADNHVYEIVHELPFDVERKTLRNYEAFVWEQFNEVGTTMLCYHPKHVHKGKKKSEEHIQNWCAARKGHVVSEETRTKIRAARALQIISPETRKKMGDTLKGRAPWNKGLTGYKHKKPTSE